MYTQDSQPQPVAVEVPPHLMSHIAHLQSFYRESQSKGGWSGYHYRRLLARYYRFLIPAEASVLEIGCGDGTLLSLLPNREVTGIDLVPELIATARKRVPHGNFYVGAGESLDVSGQFDYIILSDTINEAADVQLIFQQLHSVITPDTRLVMNFYNGLWKPVLTLAEKFGWKRKTPPLNWLSPRDVQNLLKISDWEPVSHRSHILLPFAWGWFERFINAVLAPLLGWFCLTNYIVARPVREKYYRNNPSVSVVIPARNEAGNIEAAVQRMPALGSSTEIIFIEGNSKDNTWEEIQRVKAQYPEMDIKIMQQTGKGKANAVREAYAVAKGDLLMILDADLTMPPEDLIKFYDALVEGKCEFANGVRLVYPMDKEAMRFLNMCANKAFGWTFSWLLGQTIKDTLCGTKVMSRRHYQSLVANRAYFGEFDPYGDFDLIFGAAKLNLSIMDVPMRYRERTYGTTNINRWSGGWLLLCMCAFAARKLKFI
jgi:SAM-dependent methyltransferase